MTIWRMRVACRIPKATYTHKQYVVLTAFHCNSGCTDAPHCSLYTYIACLVLLLAELIRVGQGLCTVPSCTSFAVRKEKRGFKILDFRFALFFFAWGFRTIQSVWRLAIGCTVRGSSHSGSEILCTRPERPWGPPSRLYNGYRVTFPRLKQLGSGVDHSSPPSVEVKERVELHLNLPSYPLTARTGLLFLLPPYSGVDNIFGPLRKASAGKTTWKT